MWRLLALRGNRDSAFALLTRAKSIHNHYMTQLEVDSAYASLRHDARYAPLLPTTHGFVNLFVEDVKVIREIDGDSTGDQFGWIGRSIAGAASRAHRIPGARASTGARSATFSSRCARVRVFGQGWTRMIDVDR